MTHEPIRAQPQVVMHETGTEAAQLHWLMDRTSFARIYDYGVEKREEMLLVKRFTLY